MLYLGVAFDALSSPVQPAGKIEGASHAHDVWNGAQ